MAGALKVTVLLGPRQHFLLCLQGPQSPESSSFLPPLSLGIEVGGAGLPVTVSCQLSAFLPGPFWRTGRTLCAGSRLEQVPSATVGFTKRKRESPGPLQAPGKWKGCVGGALPSLLGPMGCGRGPGRAGAFHYCSGEFYWKFF